MSLKITALEYTEVKITEWNSNFDNVTIWYNVNDTYWDDYEGGQTIALNEGQFVEFINYSGMFSDNSGNIGYRLESTGHINVSGDLASMLNADWQESGNLPSIYDGHQTFMHFFDGCPIVDASELTVEFDVIQADYAFEYMFANCYALTKGPNLANKNLYYQCYRHLFDGCENLQEITYGYSSLNSYFNDGWMENNAGSYGGIFYYTDPNFDTSSISWFSSDGLPGNWQVEAKITEPEYFRVTARGYSTILISFIATDNVSPNVNLEYRREGEGWQYYGFDNPRLWVNGGSYIEFRNTSSQFSNNQTRISLYSTGEIDVSGELYTLLDYQNDPYLDDGFYADPYAFASLFNGCDVVDAENLKLFPRNSIRIYDSMFANCIKLQTNPLIDFNIKTENGSYFAMFSGCTSLQNLNSNYGSQYFAESACESMFANCTGIDLFYGFYANGVGRASFANMFSGCINLTGVYNIEIRYTDNASYQNMFKNCTKLQSIPNFTYATGYMQTNCFKGMFEGCTSLTTIPNLPSIYLFEGCYERMFANCTGIIDITFNDATRQPNCYKEMFDGCTSLNNITFNAKSLSESYNENWLRNVSPTGTFYYTNKEFKASAAPRSPSGIPVGWSIKSLIPRDKISFELNGNFVGNLSIAGKNVTKMLLNDQLIYEKPQIPEGYIMFFDGIDNTGTSHDDLCRRWTSKVGGLYATRSSGTATDKSVVINGSTNVFSAIKKSDGTDWQATDLGVDNTIVVAMKFYESGGRIIQGVIGQHGSANNPPIIWQSVNSANLGLERYENVSGPYPIVNNELGIAAVTRKLTPGTTSIQHTMFKNGNVLGTLTDSTSKQGGMYVNNCLIGYAGYGVTRYMHGEIYGILMWNRALTEDEVKQVSNYLINRYS